MSKFHINDKGEAGKCGAEKGQCPFGGREEHFASKDEAREAFEHTMKNDLADVWPEVKQVKRELSQVEADNRLASLELAHATRDQENGPDTFAAMFNPKGKRNQEDIQKLAHRVELRRTKAREAGEKEAEVVARLAEVRSAANAKRLERGVKLKPAPARAKSSSAWSSNSGKDASSKGFSEGYVG